MVSPVKLWRNQKYSRSQLGRTGTIVSWTVIRVPPEGYASQAPYPVVVVELETGERVIAQMVDWEQTHCAVGQKVETILRRIAEPSQDGVIGYGVKVRPV